jgi:hypothetical protein
MSSESKGTLARRCQRRVGRVPRERTSKICANTRNQKISKLSSFSPCKKLPEVSSHFFVVNMMLLTYILIYIVRCVTHAWGIFLSDSQNLYFLINADSMRFANRNSTTPICTTRASTSDVFTPQACHIMSSVIRSDLIHVVFSLNSAINHELLL